MGVTVLSRAVQLYVLPSANYPVLQVARSENILIALPSAVPAQVIAAGLRGDSGPQGIPGPPGPATVVGVESFNNRQNNVTLLAEDVTGALGYTPVNPSGLVIPDSPEDIGAATAAQGAKADSAIQPSDLTAALDTKVSAVAGKGLSTNDFSDAEKTKLENLTEPTATSVKALYESNADTNAFTDAEKAKLVGIASGATANDTDANLKNRANHSGTQPASTISDLLEVTQDMVGALIVPGDNISVAYDDTAGTLTISAASGTGIAPENAQAAETLSTGQYVNLYWNAGVLSARKAGGAGKQPAHGFVIADVTSGGTVAVYPLAMMNAYLTGLVGGTTYYLSTSVAGAVQDIPPAASGLLRQELGVAASPSKIYHTHSLPVELI